MLLEKTLIIGEIEDGVLKNLAIFCLYVIKYLQINCVGIYISLDIKDNNLLLHTCLIWATFMTFIGKFKFYLTLKYFVNLRYQIFFFRVEKKVCKK